MSTLAYQMTAKQILLVGSVSYATFGLYIATFALAIWSAHLTRNLGASTMQRNVMCIVWLTAIMIVLRQVTISLWLKEELCNIQPLFSYFDCDIMYDPTTYVTVPLLVNAYTPPIVALLSDSILAWRVYVVWHQSSWLRYVLGCTLVINCATGLATAIWISDGQNGVVDLFAFYQAWAWMAFIVNSALSVSILVRIKLFNGFHWQGRGVHLTLLRALMESAVLSWIATFSCAVLWSYNRSSDNFQGFFPSLESLTLTATERLATSMFYTLPSLLGISQVLIITRVNLSKFETASDMTQAFTSVAVQDSQATDQAAVDSSTR